MMVCKLGSGHLAWLAAGAVSLAACGDSALAAVTSSASSPGWKIQTVAGGPGGPGPARSVSINGCAVTFAGGRLFVAGGDGLVRGISLRTGWLTTMAGTTGLLSSAYGKLPPTPDGTPATQASLEYDCGVAVDRAGNVFVSDGVFYNDGAPDFGNNLVRVVAARTGTFYGLAMKAGAIYTIAGNGIDGFAGDGGPATSAELEGPAGLTVDAAGNVVVADTGNDRLRLIAATSGTFYGQAMTAGDIYTIAGVGVSGPLGNGGPATSAVLGIDPQPGGEFFGTQPMPVISADRNGNIVMADPLDGEVRVIAASSGRFYDQQMKAGFIYQVGGSFPQEFNNPGGVAVDAAGNIVVADTGNNRVKVIATRSGRFYGQSMTAGHIYTIAGGGHAGYGGPATKAALDGPTGVAVDSAGNIVIASVGVQVVPVRSGRYYGQVMKADDIYPVAGYGSQWPAKGVLAVRAQVAPVAAMTTDRHRNVIIANGDRILVAASVSGRFYGLAMRAGYAYSVAGGGTEPAAGGRPAAKVRLPASEVAIDRAGNLLTGDMGFRRITVVAERTGRFYGQPMNAGHVYAVAGTGKAGHRGDGGPATRATVLPWAITVAPDGNIVLSDFRSTIRVVAQASGRFYGRRMKAGDIYTIAGGGTAIGHGGLATSYDLAPVSVAVDRAGNVVFGDGGANEAEVVPDVSGTFYGQPMTAGHLYIIAGNGSFGPPTGDGGPATKAVVDPEDAVLDTAGNVVIGDEAGNTGGRVRVVAERTATFYGQPMTAGDIYTIAGGGTAGLGDGGPALHAEMDFANAVAVQNSGAILVADNSRVRLISP